jgi:paraquat-inducible protein A
MIARASQLGFFRCRLCGCVEQGLTVNQCGRCGRALSLPSPMECSEKALAWLLAAVVLYIPANLFPVMHVRGIGGDTDSTILGGVWEFWRSGSWGVAALIFGASVVVPLTKFIALGLLVAGALRGSSRGQLQRARLFRFVEFVGYWSMLDVVVVALTARIVHFGTFASAEPRAGIVFFCAVVMLTMKAAFSFDSRTIWISAGTS